MSILDCSMPFEVVNALEGDRISGGVDRTRIYICGRVLLGRNQLSAVASLGGGVSYFRPGVSADAG